MRRPSILLPTISFSRKSTLNMFPINSGKKQAVLYTCSAYHSSTDVHVRRQTATRNLRFCTTSVLLSTRIISDISMTQFRKQFLWLKQLPKWGTVQNNKDFINMQWTRKGNTILDADKRLDYSTRRFPWDLARFPRDLATYLRTTEWLHTTTLISKTRCLCRTTKSVNLVKYKRMLSDAAFHSYYENQEDIWYWLW